jgi:hypothetical protein
VEVYMEQALKDSVRTLKAYIQNQNSQQTLVLAGVGMDGAALSAPRFARFAKAVSAAIVLELGGPRTSPHLGAQPHLRAGEPSIADASGKTSARGK